MPQSASQLQSPDVHGWTPSFLIPPFFNQRCVLERFLMFVKVQEHWITPNIPGALY
jgi:hypothetical protein